MLKFLSAIALFTVVSLNAQAATLQVNINASHDFGTMYIVTSNVSYGSGQYAYDWNFQGQGQILYDGSSFTEVLLNSNCNSQTYQTVSLTVTDLVTGHKATTFVNLATGGVCQGGMW